MFKEVNKILCVDIIYFQISVEPSSLLHQMVLSRISLSQFCREIYAHTLPRHHTSADQCPSIFLFLNQFFYTIRLENDIVL